MIREFTTAFLDDNKHATPGGPCSINLNALEAFYPYAQDSQHATLTLFHHTEIPLLIPYIDFRDIVLDSLNPKPTRHVNPSATTDSARVE